MLRTRTEKPLRQGRDGGPQVLAIVEHQESSTGSQVFDERLLNGEVLPLLDVGCVGKSGNSGGGVVDGGELGHEDVAVEFVPQFVGESLRQVSSCQLPLAR